MPPKGDTTVRNGLESLPEGLIAIHMPEDRRAEALRLVHEVTAVNHVTGFQWYKTPQTDELCCWWAGHRINVLWVWKGNVHVRTSAVTLPSRPTDWCGHDGHVGWYLAGAER